LPHLLALETIAARYKRTQRSEVDERLRNTLTRERTNYAHLLAG